jgi:hypothetical protein
VVEFFEEAAVVELGAGVGVALVLHRSGGDAGVGEATPEVEGILLGGPGGDEGVQFLLVLPAAERVAEAGLLGPGRIADDGAERAPLGIGGDIDRDPAVVAGAGVDVVGGVGGVLVALRGPVAAVHARVEHDLAEIGHEVLGLG